MACNSLFSYEVGATGVIQPPINLNFSGSISVGGYTTPGWTTTTTVPAVSHWNVKNICVPTDNVNCVSNYTSTCTSSGFMCAGITTYNCTTSANECGATTEIYTETFTHPTNVHRYSGIPLWPATSVTGSANMEIIVTATEAIVIPPPNGITPLSIVSANIKLSNVTLTYKVGDLKQNINIDITETITLEVNSAGGFDVIIPIPDATFSDTQTSNIPGVGNVTYGFSGSAYILLCAEPVPPMSFVNIVFDTGFSVTCNNPITNEPISFNSNFSVACPMGEE